MASIARDSNGRKRLLVMMPDSSRQAIRLGKMSARSADTIKTHVEELIGAKLANRTPADETSKWLAGLDDVMLAKLAALGLVEPRQSVNLGPFIEDYISKRIDVGPATVIKYREIQNCLLEFFGACKVMRTVTTGDAEDFRLFLLKKVSENTARRRTGLARQIFTAAKKRGLVNSNPFDGLPVTIQANTEKFYFVTRSEAQKILEACPDAEWRLTFVLARFGGVRTPSEQQGLAWADVDWARGRLRVSSPKTKRHEGGASRVIPLFPELLPHLREAFENAQLGSVYIVPRCRDGKVNLRTQFERIIRRAGLEPWPKLFQNLRSTRETELAEKYPIHVVCRWMGNSVPVASKHYLQLTDEHFDRAVADLDAAQNAAQQPVESPRNDSQASGGDSQEVSELQTVATNCESPREEKVGHTGLEPVTSSMSRKRASQLR